MNQNVHHQNFGKQRNKIICNMEELIQSTSRINTSSDHLFKNDSEFLIVGLELSFGLSFFHHHHLWVGSFVCGDGSYVCDRSLLCVNRALYVCDRSLLCVNRALLHPSSCHSPSESWLSQCTAAQNRPIDAQKNPTTTKKRPIHTQNRRIHTQ